MALEFTQLSASTLVGQNLPSSLRVDLLVVWRGGLSIMVTKTRKQTAAEAEANGASAPSDKPTKPRAKSSSRVSTEKSSSTTKGKAATPPELPQRVEAPLHHEQGSTVAVDVPTIPLYDFDLPLELDFPYGSRISAFNPAPYESLKRKLQLWFPDLALQHDNQSSDPPQQSAIEAGHKDKSKSKRSKAAPISGKSPSATNGPSTAEPKRSKRTGKAKRPDYIHLEVEFVPQLVSDLDLQLPRTSRGWSGTMSTKPHAALAVVALAPPDYSILMTKEWIQLYGEVSLAPPFLPPESEVFGPDAFETSAKRGSAPTPGSSSLSIKAEPGTDSLTQTRDAFSLEGPRIFTRGSNVPSTRLLGVLSVQVGLEAAALQYGAGKDDVDGFVASHADLKNTAAEGSLGLARALRQAIPSVVDWEHGFVELDADTHTYWDRNESFYDLPPKQKTLSRHLVLDQVESLDLLDKSSSKSPSKKRKRSSNASRASRSSLLSGPFPTADEDDEDRDDRRGHTCYCPSCINMRDRRREAERSAPSSEPSRPKLEALPLGEQVSSTDARLGDVTSEKFLPLDTNIASLLEACRPRPDGPRAYPPSDVIPTPLLGYQARCLAWMIKRETVVDEDVGQLMPNWIPLRCKAAAHIKQRRLQLEAEREALLDAMQRDLSRSRRNANVKAAQAAFIASSTAENSAASKSDAPQRSITESGGPPKREPFIDPTEQIFYFDQVSGLLSLRRFCCRSSEPGGALCESMGLGKTLESLSLIAARPRLDNPILLEYDTSRSARMIAALDPSERPFVSQATLVVCPAALVEQWMDEIRKHFRSRSRSRSGSNVDESSQDDANSVNQQPGVVRYRHADFAWDVHSRRADVRTLAKKKLVKPDIVVATYEELASQLAESHKVPHSSDQVRTPLLEVLFWRILLDEAQIVAGASSKATSMVHELWRSNCWMVTGTPVTKGIRDIQGIFAFMDHDPLAAPRFFRDILQQPFSRGCVEGVRRLRALLPRYVWRHTQAHVEDEIVLPPCRSEVLELRLKHVERLFYDKEVSKFRESFAKQAARGVANVAQPSFLVHLRQLLSHPQVADEYLYFHNYSRLSFAELFQRFFQQAEAELGTFRMQVVSSTLQLVWGHDFYVAETDKRRWRGGKTPLESRDAICQLLNAALRVVTLALDEQARQSIPASIEGEAANAEGPSDESGMQSTNIQQDHKVETSAEAAPSPSALPSDAAMQPASGATESTARINLSWEEADYWLRVLLQRHADPASGGDEGAGADIEPPARWDPERPSRTCFDKEFKDADDASVDLNDPRFHLVIQDASAEDMDEEEYLAQIAAEQSAKNQSHPAEPRKKNKKDAAFQPGLLKKARLRGKATQRQKRRVWSYKPKERLDTTHAKLLQQRANLPGKEHEVAFLRQQLLEGLSVETKTGSGEAGDPADAPSGEAPPPGPECQICFEPKMQIGVLPCYHSFCADCIDILCQRNSRSVPYVWTSWNKPRCPKCRLQFHPDRVTRIMERGRSASADSSETVVGDWSGKISGLIMDLQARLAQDPTHKAVVFSHWPKMLNFMCEALVQNDIAAVVFGGNEAKQAEALRAIRDDEKVRVILVPFRASAGAAGLTLTSCNLAYLMEPALDAALEAQAIGRIHRIGQRRETTVLRVKMKDTIEDAVMHIADERSRRGMELATHTDPTAAASSAVSVPAPISESGAGAAASSAAAVASSAGSSLTAETSGQGSSVRTVGVKTEEQDPLQPVKSSSELRERSIKSSVAASVGVGRETDSTSLRMTEVGLILGFDVEEEKRKAKDRRESVLRRADELGMYVGTTSITEREVDMLELDIEMEEEERAMEEEEERQWALADEEEERVEALAEEEELRLAMEEDEADEQEALDLQLIASAVGNVPAE
ncbi:putative DNA repair protein RAD5 (putative) [Pseudozyma hubeiensis]|nr:putative DNA repair protein RAD5 (putative) [Pseudozyma hubeiensis]